MTRTCEYKAEEIQIHLIFVVNTELSKPEKLPRPKSPTTHNPEERWFPMTCTLRVEKEQREFIVRPTKGIQSKLCF